MHKIYVQQSLATDYHHLRQLIHKLSVFNALTDVFSWKKYFLGNVLKLQPNTPRHTGGLN